MPVTAGFLASDVSRFLKQLLSNDALMLSYAPGGFFSQHPPQGQPVTGSPCVRWWEQSPGKPARRQDPYATVVLARPSFVVAMLDRQKGGQFSELGTNSMVDLGARRIQTLLDGKTYPVTLSTGSYLFYSQGVEYQMSESDAGDILFMSGMLLSFMIQ